MKRIKCFIAGSKNQERQREILLSVFSNMQTKWNVMFETKSFLNFNGTLSSDGQQKDYNKYISLKADLIIFVFDNNVGDKTIEEFVVAYKSLLLRRHPDILVFCNEAITDDLNIKVMNIMMNQLQQYYIEYCSEKDLKQKFSDEIDKYIKNNKDRTFLRWFIDHVIVSGRYNNVKNYTILILGLLLLFSITYHFRNKLNNNIENNIKMEEQSIYDGRFILESKTIKTVNNIVRIEKLTDGFYRYLSWNISRGQNGNKEPSLVIYNGEYLNEYYRFKKGSYLYLIPEMEGNQLLIMEKGKVLGYEDVIDFNYKGNIEQQSKSVEKK